MQEVALGLPRAVGQWRVPGATGRSRRDGKPGCHHAELRIPAFAGMTAVAGAGVVPVTCR